MPGIDNLVKITLDKERHLRLTLKGMIEFEKLTGKNLLEGFSLEEFSLEHTAAILFASLVHEDNELTYDKVLNMVDMGNLVAVMNAVTECLTQMLPKAEEGERPLAKKSQPG